LNTPGKKPHDWRSVTRPHPGSGTQKTEVVNIAQTPGGMGYSVRLAAAVSSGESCG
jgi:hypothetical protein